MRSQIQVSLLLAGLTCLAAADSTAGVGVQFLLTKEPADSAVAVVQKGVCKKVQSVSGVRNRIECAYRCGDAGCSAAAFKDGVCRMVFVETSMYIGLKSGCDMDSDFSAASGEAAFEWRNIGSQLNISYSVYRNTSTGASGTIQTMTVNQTGCYRMEALGARGGSTNPTYSPVYTGGFGAYIGGDFNLTAGTQISVVIGQRGGDANELSTTSGSGGGGGTFVYRSSDNLLYLAAGGGGGGSRSYYGSDGSTGLSGTASNGAAAYGGTGGAGGQPGNLGSCGLFGFSWGQLDGGPGAGWLGGASARTSASNGDRGGGLSLGWVGGAGGNANLGAVGGFGGGGGGSQSPGASGGGGGYSGGGAGCASAQAGGGGGSFCSGRSCSGVSGGNSFSDGGLLLVHLIRTGTCP